jgi:uncharacterized oligopeptide transporter (OPT) family protein
MGFPTTLSMNLGMLVGWAVLAPLAKHRGWATGKVSDAEGGRGWILWIALAIMVRQSSRRAIGRSSLLLTWLF